MMFSFDKGIAPDLPEYGHEFLVKARNCYSGVLGYEPVKSPSALTAALPAAWLGSGAFRDPTGVVTLLAAASGLGLYTLTATTATNVYSSASTANWFFVQFGGIAITVNGGPPVKYNLSAGTAALLGGSPPNASMAAIVRDFVFLAGDPTHQNRVSWSSINNAEAWTAGINQSSTQDLPDEGATTGLSGGEFGLVFQDAAINIFEYVGSPLIFTRRKISNSIGALCHGSIAQHNRLTFFYSRRGFYKFIDGEVVPIGRNKVDRTFRNTYSITDIRNQMRCAIDPERSLVIWSMPDRLWVYNFENDMWSDILIVGLVGVSSSRTASITLEGVASTFPSIETVTPSLDDPFWNAGDPLLTFAQNDNKLYTLGGATNLDASLRLPNLELNDGRVSHVRNSRVTGTMQGAQISIDCRARMGDTPINTVSSDFRSNGYLPIRCSGKYVQPEVILSSAVQWTSVQGLDLEASAGGRL